VNGIHSEKMVWLWDELSLALGFLGMKDDRDR
jgi:hypothetical protein